ncbi:MAG: hypothetical protein J1E33_01990 [Alistipes sp.]|nr:hypothetical protein [Alistipes sp.]
MKKIFFAIAALCLVGTWSCSFDDSDINDRLGDLEDRVTAIESQLEQINSDLQTLDRITDLLNKNGVVSSVEPNATGTGYIVTVTYFDAETPAKTFEIVNGKDGSKGEDGTGSVVGVKLDNATNRWYWTVDGQPLYGNDGEYLWTSGKDGQDSDFNIDGTGTGNVKLAYMDKTTNGPADTKDNAVDETLYLWVYNSALNKYVNRGTVPSSTKTLVSAKFENGVLTIYQDGEEVFSSEIQANGLAVTLVADDKTVAEHSTVKLTANEDTVFTVNVSGASTNYALKASMQNGDGYTVKVKDSNVTVKAEEDATDDKLFIEVLDGNKCYHTWVLLTLNGNVDPEPGPGEADYHATLSLPQTNDDDYLPVAFGDKSTGMPETVSTTLVVTLDKPATETLTLTLDKVPFYDDPDDTSSWAPDEVGGLTFEKTITFAVGEQTKTVTVTFNRSGLENDNGAAFAVTSSNVTYDRAGFYIANNFTVPYTLTADMFDTTYTTDIEKMFDGNSETYMKFNVTNANMDYKNIYTFGYWFDMTLPENVYVGGVRYQNADGGYPGEVGYAVSTDGTTFLGPYSKISGNLTANNWFTITTSNLAGAKALRFCVTKIYTSGTYAGMATQPNYDCRVAEFELLVMY